jgi:DNA polymerase-3 subunit alpha
VFEALVHAGALDGLGGHRAQYMAALDRAISEALLKQEERELGQASLFGEASGGGPSAQQKPTLPHLPAWSESDRLANEKAILGFYVSGTRWSRSAPRPSCSARTRSRSSGAGRPTRSSWRA